MKQKSSYKYQQSQEDLVDLPQDVPQSPWKQFLLTPKFLILLVLALFFIGKNIYENYVMERPKDVQQKKPKEQPPMTQELFMRFFWYIVMLVVFLALYIYLRIINDKAQQQKIRAEIRKQQEQMEINKKIQQKANKIVLSMDQFGNVVNEKNENDQKSQNQKQTNETKKQV